MKTDEYKNALHPIYSALCKVESMIANLHEDFPEHDDEAEDEEYNDNHERRDFLEELLYQVETLSGQDEFDILRK